MSKTDIEHIDNLFPYDSYRDKQRECLLTAKRMLDSGEYDNVIIDAPTGVGKSAINVALCRDSEDAFYCTPQKKLREQLDDDKVLNNFYKTLRARRDYTCGVTGDSCEDCEVYNDSKMSCAQRDECTYMNHKHIAVDEDIAVLTFAYLIVDGKLPPNAGFDDRELLVVDECHNLANQVASLFLGFHVSPYNLPDDVFGTITRDLIMDVEYYEGVMPIMKSLRDRCRGFVSKYEDKGKRENAVEQCEEFLEYCEWFFEDVSGDGETNPWVVDTGHVEYDGQQVKTFKLKPIDVARFLNFRIWNRAEKRILSTATMPYRNDPDKWCRELGLDASRTGVIHVRMPFPKRNRPIYTGRMVADMSGGGDKENWEGIMETLNNLTSEHLGQKGLLHTASYQRASNIKRTAEREGYKYLKDNIIVPDRSSGSEVVEEWYESDYDLCASPSMTDGVDLYGDRCRWQALVKVPYPSPSDPRVNYLLEHEPERGWQWYYTTTANRVIQSAGRAVRSKADYANYYVLDKSFDKVKKKVNMPNWFTDAIVEEEGHANSALDW